MAYFAEINNNNVVTNVYKVRNELIIENNQESEQKGINHLKKILGQNKNFIKTSYNTKKWQAKNKLQRFCKKLSQQKE